MSADHPHLTPEQAREQLTSTTTRSLLSPRDRRVHAIGTALFGVGVAVHMATENIVTGAAGAVLSGVVLAALLGETVWVERAARAVPRRARLWSRLGIGVSFVLALVVVLPWLDLAAQDEPNTWPMVVTASLVVAGPSLAAAAVIAGGRR